MMRILSVVEALDHAGIATGTKVNIRWIDSEELDDTSVDPKEVFEVLRYHRTWWIWFSWCRR